MDPLSAERPIKETIIEKLSEVEKKHQIKILHACEVGSRAWGLENVNSDYDVKFIYVRRLPFYFSIEEARRDVIDDNSELDMNGWDLRKALGLLRESNCSILEWIYSEHTYKTDPAFLTKISDLATRGHCRVRLLSAYCGKAIKHFREYIQVESSDGTVAYKKYLFIVQSLLFAQWILAFAPEGTSLPPQDFSTLLNSFKRTEVGEPVPPNQHTTLRADIIDLVVPLAASKRAGTLKNAPRNKVLDDWIVATYTNFGTLFKGMAKTDSLDPSVYNALLAEMVTSANGYRLVPEESYFEADGGRPA